MIFLDTIAAALVIATIPQLDAARVVIRHGETSTRVEASYRVDAAEGESVRLRVRRLAGQELELLSGAEPGALRYLPGLAELEVAPADGVELVYELTGERERVALFVPDPPTDPLAGAVEIELWGLSGERALRDGLPRLEAGPDGVLVARPANVPSVVRLPPPRGRLTVNRIVETLVVLLVVGASSGWVLWRRR